MRRTRRDWKDYLGANAKSFVTTARVLQHFVKQIVPSVIDPTNAVLAEESDPAVDWPAAYRTPPKHFQGLMKAFDPRFADEIPKNGPLREAALRSLFRGVESTVKNVNAVTDQTTGMITKEALATAPFRTVMEQGMEHIVELRLELKAFVHNLVAVMKFGKPMLDVLVAAEQGKADALSFVLSINPSLVYRPGVARHVQRAFASRDYKAVVKTTRPVTLQKYAAVGLTLMVLWDAGLRWLSYKQIHRFLKAVGLPSPPSPQSLERYAERLDLMKNL